MSGKLHVKQDDVAGRKGQDLKIYGKIIDWIDRFEWLCFIVLFTSKTPECKTIKTYAVCKQNSEGIPQLPVGTLQKPLGPKTLAETPKHARYK